MALESSSGLRSSTTPKLRTSSLIVLSAGAALFALISYLYIKKRQQIESKSQQEDTQKVVVEKEMSIKEEEKVTSQSDEKKTSSSGSVCCDGGGNLEKISHDLVKIVLNSATKILNDHPSDSISDTIKNVEEIELEVGVNDLNLHSISLLDNSSTSSSSEQSSSDTSLLESPKSYHHHSLMDTDHDNDNEQHQNVPGGVHPGLASLIKSSSTTSTASSSSSAAISTSNQAVPPSSSNKSQNKQHKNINNQKHNNMIDSTGTKTKPKSSTSSSSSSTSPNTTTSTLQSTQQQQQPTTTTTPQSQPSYTSTTATPTPLPTPTSPGSTHEDIVVYEFNFPRKFCGKLIGKNGIHVDFIRSKTRTQIAVRDDPEKHEQQIVCVSGRLEDVDQALDIISSRFPIKQYPNVSFKPISKPILYRRLSTNGENNKRVLPFENSCVKKVLVAPNMFVDIKPAANEMTNVHVSAIVNASHVFVQLPGNATYESLQKLDEHMLEVYGGNGGGSGGGSVSNSNNKEIPLMVEPVEYGSICVAPTSYGWHRAMVTEYLTADEARQQVSDYSETCGLVTVKFLDYGGYMTIPANQLRQLRSDFMLLPFQAVECYLDGIYVFQGTEEEGKKFLSEIIQGAQLKISLCGYAEDGIPLIKLFLTSDIQNVNLNSELVNYSYAIHIDAPLSSNTSTSEEASSLTQSLELDSPTNTEQQYDNNHNHQQPQQSIPKVIEA